ncbi:MAG: DUF460 domain-containing protein [Euryarchaeota archaeon]|nr:DUF460 domain-containing protein [Euryarchaeota archaeon]
MELKEAIVFGVDVATGSIRAQKQPQYAVVALKNDRIIFEERNLSYFKLIRLIRKHYPAIIATDNIYELIPSRRGLFEFISRLPVGTKLIQVTGSPKSGMLPLHVLANSHGIALGAYASPQEEALTSARLALKGVGYEIVTFEDEARVIVSRARSLGPGGSSQDRYRRRLHNLVQYKVREIQRSLEQNKLDYELEVKEADSGYARGEFIICANPIDVRKVVRKIRGPDIQVKIKPVKSGGLSFVPLTETKEKIKTFQKNLIIGIDPGITTAIAALDFKGKLVKLHSSKEFPRNEIIRFISELGNPIIFATDVLPPPKSVEKLASSFEAELFNPAQSLSISEKNELIENYLEDSEDEAEPVDAHQRDALAAAIKAYNHYKNKFKQVDQQLKTVGKPEIEEKVKELVIAGHSISSAIELATSKEVEVKAEKIEIKPKEEKIEPELIIDLKKKLKFQREEIEQLKTLNEKLKAELKYYNEKIAKIEQKIDFIKSAEFRELKATQEIAHRDKLIRHLKNEFDQVHKKYQMLVKEFEQLKQIRVLEISGKRIPIKVVQTFAKEGVQEAINKFGLKKGDVILLANASGGGASTAEFLIKLGVKAVIYGGDMSHLAIEKFQGASLPLIPVETIKFEKVGDIVTIDPIELENSLKKFKKKLSTEELVELLEEYKVEREKDSTL